MISMKDIARACDVSVATVSKALSDQRDISEETRQRVKQAAEDMGYLTNANARALKTNRTYNLGILFEDEQHSGLTHEYFSTILESFKKESEKRGYNITFINQFFGTKKTTYLQHCRYRGLDGVLIANINYEDPEVIELVNSSIPVVSIDYIYSNATSIRSDNAGGMKQLVDYVHSKNHEKIALIHGEKTLVTQYRLASFYRCCKAYGIRIPEEYVRESRFHDTDRCEKETEALLALEDRPTCIFFPDDFSAIGGFRAIAKAGLKIPEDISVVGYDGINLASVLSPPLTTHKQDTIQIGKLSAEQLIAAIEEPKTTVPEQIMVCGTLMEGKSVRQL